MPERLSKIVLALEALLIAAPLTLLYFFFVFPSALFSSLLLQSSWLSALNLIVTVSSLLAGWSLMVKFWRTGAGGLKDSPPFIWGLAYVGAVSVLIALVVLIAGQSLGWTSLANSEVTALLFGIPLLLPFGHLFAERQLRSAASMDSQL